MRSLFCWLCVSGLGVSAPCQHRATLMLVWGFDGACRCLAGQTTTASCACVWCAMCITTMHQQGSREPIAACVLYPCQTINHATTAAPAGYAAACVGKQGGIGTLGAKGREGDSPRIENLDTGILNWLNSHWYAKRGTQTGAHRNPAPRRDFCQ